ncbi:MAG TPA: adenylate/guanylate cyclase domain-containing protein, partial [Roseiarcus sp.]|nr:adenylate/guanylate cyclase domain-containing protein [Roseiarcus sp.]
MTETRKLAAILVADIVGYSRLMGADEELMLARLRSLRSDLIDPTISIHQGRIVKRTGDGAIVEFRSVVEAVRCAMEVRAGLADRNAGLPADKRIEARVGIHLGDVVEESDGDLMGDGVNVAARLEGICEPGCVCLSAAAYEQVRDKLHVTFVDLGEQSLKNITRPVRAYMLKAAEGGAADSQTATAASRSRPSVLQWATIAVAFLAVLIAAGWFGSRVFAPSPPPSPPIASTQNKLISAPRLSIVVLPFANLSGNPEQDYFADGLSDDLTTDLSHLPGSFVIAHNTALTYKGKAVDVKEIGRELGVRYAVEGSVRRVGETI